MKKETAEPPTFSEIAQRHLRDHVMLYRSLVCRASQAESLTANEMNYARKCQRRMNLPEWSWRRDVLAAVRMAGIVSAHVQAELVAEYPHLFENADAWARRRMATMERRRQMRAAVVARRAGVPLGRAAAASPAPDQCVIALTQSSDESPA
jgi:hypothetical protein